MLLDAFLLTIDKYLIYKIRDDNKIKAQNIIASIDSSDDFSPILLTAEILLNWFGFAVNGTDVFAKTLYNAVFATNPATNIRDMVKPPTYLIIKLDEGNGRFTTYLYHDNNKIYIAEQSYVHELQLMLFMLTGNFPIIKL